jgi:hypothetical protein
MLALATLGRPAGERIVVATLLHDFLNMATLSLFPGRRWQGPLFADLAVAFGVRRTGSMSIA